MCIDLTTIASSLAYKNPRRIKDYNDTAGRAILIISVQTLITICHAISNLDEEIAK